MKHPTGKELFWQAFEDSLDEIIAKHPELYQNPGYILPAKEIKELLLMTEEERNKISDYFNNQKGQNYPCSNQLVCCGFVTEDDSKWNDFVEQNRENIARLTKRDFVLKNNEKWIRVCTSKASLGCRFYKIKVDKNISKKIIEENILPCCTFYCCNFEWI